MLDVIRDKGIPWVWTGGNNKKGIRRDQMMRIDMEFDYMLSWTGYKWDLGKSSNPYSEENLGYFTSRIPIMDFEGK